MCAGWSTSLPTHAQHPPVAPGQRAPSLTGALRTRLLPLCCCTPATVIQHPSGTPTHTAHQPPLSSPVDHAHNHHQQQHTPQQHTMPTPDTAAAAAALHDDQAATHEADVLLDLVLAHTLPSLHQRDVCALLCTSAATAAAVVRNGSGRLAVSAAPATPAQAQSLSRWLGTHSGLVRALEVGPTAAAHAPVGVLRQLTGLRSLKLLLTAVAGNAADGPAVAAVLRPLTQLTALELRGTLMPSETQANLPASLQRLTASWRWAAPQPDTLQLGHLTALTELDLWDIEHLADGDVLPPNLVRLCGWWANDGVLAVVQGLSSLRHLDGWYSVQQLCEFAAAGLTQLTYVGLTHYCSYNEPDDSDQEGEGGAADWGLGDVVQQLTNVGVAGAVRSVELWGDDGVPRPNLGPAMLDALKLLPVQSLTLQEVECDVSSLAVLTQLSRLDVGSTVFNPAEYEALPDELASLPCLRKLELRRPRDDAAAEAAHDAFAACIAESRPQLTLVCW